MVSLVCLALASGCLPHQQQAQPSILELEKKHEESARRMWIIEYATENSQNIPYKPNAYGPGLHSDGTGRPFVPNYAARPQKGLSSNANLLI